jgi:cephalosporin hydroxylase
MVGSWLAVQDVLAEEKDGNVYLGHVVYAPGKAHAYREERNEEQQIDKSR